MWLSLKSERRGEKEARQEENAGGRFCGWIVFVCFSP